MTSRALYARTHANAGGYAVPLVWLCALLIALLWLFAQAGAA